MNMIQRRIEKTKTSLRRLPLKIRSIKYRLASLSSSGGRPVIAFHVIGGLGDHILSARFIRDFLSQAGEFEFDIYTKRPPLAEWIFRTIPGCRNILHVSSDIKWIRMQYALFIDAIGFLAIRYENKKALSKPEAHPLLKLCGSISARKEALHNFIEKQPMLDGYLGYYASIKGKSRHNFLHYIAEIEYEGDELHLPVADGVLGKHNLIPRTYITISNGFDDQFTISPGQLVTKVYPYHAQVAVQLKKAFPSLKIIQIGASTSTPIESVDLNLVGSTTLAEAAALLKHALLHIDNEGGLVHLARALGTRSCVVFGPTLSSYFGYEANLNISPLVCGGCWWMEGRWMTQCVRGDARPVCMYTQPPENVAARIVEFLGSSGPAS